MSEKNYIGTEGVCQKKHKPRLSTALVRADIAVHITQKKKSKAMTSCSAAEISDTEMGSYNHIPQHYEVKCNCAPQR